MKTPLYTLLLWAALAAPALAQNCDPPARGLTLERSTDQLTLAWSQVVNAPGYEVQFRPAGGTWTTFSPSNPGDTTLVITGLSPQSTYEWQVRSICGSWSTAVFTHATSSPGTFWRQGGAVRCEPYNYPRLSPTLRDVLLAINNNPYSAVEEEGYWQRHSRVIENRNLGNAGGQYFENEKSAYPNASMTLINAVAAGDSVRYRSMRTFLESPDRVDTWNFTTTDSVDLFPCFTLKGQVPRYFYMGQQAGIVRGFALSKMYNAFGLWTYNGTTPTDPLGRPHPRFNGTTGCWDPTCRNSWVDSRNTDNLKAMRESSVFLFASEIGNTTVANTYRQRIYTHTATLYANGFSEWDSENYIPHAIAPWLNLYTYTDDAAMKGSAKASVDWYLAINSLKYFRGIYSGPTKRLNAASLMPLGGGGPLFPFLYFGGTPIPHPDIEERDQYISFLSHYRPPMAHLQIARKQMRLPVEMVNTKPTYGTFSPNSAPPHSFETMYFGKTYQMGSVLTSGAVNDMRPFNLAVFDTVQGAQAFFINASDTVLRHDKPGGCQVGQFRNLAIHLRPAGGNLRWFIFVRDDVPVIDLGAVRIYQYEKTWVAVRPLGNTITQSPRALTGDYRGYSVHHFDPLPGQNYHGLALEVVDAADFNYDVNAFQTALLNAPFDDTQLAAGLVTLGSVHGHKLKMQHNAASDMATVYRNSATPFNYLAHNFVYKSYPVPAVDAQAEGLPTAHPDSVRAVLTIGIPRLGPLTQTINGGTLKVVSNDYVFTSSANTQGQTTFNEAPADNTNATGPVTRVEIYDMAQGSPALLHSETGSWGWSPDNYQFTARLGHPYRVRVYTADGEYAERDLNITMVDTKGTLAAATFALYPNPANHTVTADIPGSYVGGNLQIVNLLGTPVLTRRIGGKPSSKPGSTRAHTEAIAVSSLPPGVYIVTLSAPRQPIIYRRFVKE